MKLPRLKEVRELHGWSQAKLAEESDVSRDSISNYETGHREAWPSTAKKLADTLGVDIADLVARAEEPVPLAEAPDTGRLRNTAERASDIADYDPYGWIQDKTIEELQQIALEEARFTKAGTYEDLVRNKDNKELHLEVPRRRVMARTLIRNIIGELELQGAPSSHIKLVLKAYDEVMSPPKETPQRSHEEQEGKETG